MFYVFVRNLSVICDSENLCNNKKYVYVQYNAFQVHLTYIFYEIILHTHTYVWIYMKAEKIAPYMVLIFNLLNYFLKIFQTLLCNHSCSHACFLVDFYQIKKK